MRTIYLFTSTKVLATKTKMLLETNFFSFTSTRCNEIRKGEKTTNRRQDKSHRHLSSCHPIKQLLFEKYKWREKWTFLSRQKNLFHLEQKRMVLFFRQNAFLLVKKWLMKWRETSRLGYEVETFGCSSGDEPRKLFSTGFNGKKVGHLMDGAWIGFWADVSIQPFSKERN